MRTYLETPKASKIELCTALSRTLSSRWPQEYERDGWEQVHDDVVIEPVVHF